MSNHVFPIERVFLQEQGHGKLRVEEQYVAAYCAAHGIPTEVFTEKRIRRRTLPVTANTPVVGDVALVTAALKICEGAPPAPLDYPLQLTSFLHRPLWRARLADIVQHWMNGNGEPVFVKPAEAEKKFTGRLINSIDDLRPLTRHAGTTELWCSTQVTWLSEYRAYIVGGKVIHTAHYAGDPDQTINPETVTQAVTTLGEAAPYGYSLDFGLLDSGETALVEGNDGYGLGAYLGVPAPDYARLILGRWCELTDAC